MVQWDNLWKHVVIWEKEDSKSCPTDISDKFDDEWLHNCMNILKFTEWNTFKGEVYGMTIISQWSSYLKNYDESDLFHCITATRDMYIKNAIFTRAAYVWVLHGLRC